MYKIILFSKARAHIKEMRTSIVDILSTWRQSQQAFGLILNRISVHELMNFMAKKHGVLDTILDNMVHGHSSSRALSTTL